MHSLCVFIFFCCSVVCVEASAMLEVSGHVGGEVSIHCSYSWTTDNSSEHYNMYFCKGVCSRENTVIQAEGKTLAITRRGRYSMEVNRVDGAFIVTIKRLRRADAGIYHCGVGKAFIVLYQEVNLIVLNASSVPPTPPLAATTTILQTEADTLPQGSSPSSTAVSPTTLPAAEEKNKEKAATQLTDTTVVIIVSVSLALLVCAIIPLIFYGHCRTNPEGQNRPEATKGEADCCEENADVASTQAADADPESSAQDAAQYAAVYQALDPKGLD